MWVLLVWQGRSFQCLIEQTRIAFVIVNYIIRFKDGTDSTENIQNHKSMFPIAPLVYRSTL